MSSQNPVGNSQTVSTSTSSAKVTLSVNNLTALEFMQSLLGFMLQSVLNQHIAANTNFYVGAGEPETLSLGPIVSAKVSGITTGATTVIDFPEGTYSPFGVGDYVTLTATGQSNFDFSHKPVTAVNTTAAYDGLFGTRITVANNSSSVTDTFNPALATDLRRSFKVAVKSEAEQAKHIFNKYNHPE